MRVAPAFGTKRPRSGLGSPPDPAAEEIWLSRSGLQHSGRGQPRGGLPGEFGQIMRGSDRSYSLVRAWRLFSDGLGKMEPSFAERPGAAQEDPQPGDPAATEAPVFHPGDEGQPPLPGTVSAAPTSRDDRLRNRLLRKKILTPVVLAFIGVALLAGAIALYTSPSELPTPPYSTLDILSTFPISDIIYRVDQVSPTIAETIIEVELPSGTPLPPVGAPTAHLVLAPPFGTGSGPVRAG